MVVLSLRLLLFLQGWGLPSCGCAEHEECSVFLARKLQLRDEALAVIDSEEDYGGFRAESNRTFYHVDSFAGASAKSLAIVDGSSNHIMMSK